MKWGDYMTNRIRKKIAVIAMMLFFVTGVVGGYAEYAKAETGSFNAFEVLPSTVARAKTKNPRILFVGNSLTFTNDLPQMVKQLCKKNGINAHVESVVKGAHTLTRYVHPSSQYSTDKELNRQLMSLLKKKKWDYVVLQDQRHAALTDVADMREAVSVLEPLIKKAGAQMVLYETWAPLSGHFDYNGARPIAANADEYQSKVASTYYSLAAKYNSALSPAGIAFARARQIYPDISLYHSDKLHPSVAGTYLSACTMYATLFGRSPEGTSWYPSMDGKTTQETAKICKKLQALAADVTIRGGVPNNAVVKFSDTSVTIKTNASKKLSYQITPAVKGTRITRWKSDNEKVATIDENGVVTGHTTGSAEITATLSNGKKAVCHVTVSQGNIQLGEGEKYKLQLGKTYKWSSSNTKVAVVQDDQIIAKKTGTAVLTGKNADDSETVIKVTVKSAPKSVKISKEKTLAVGKSAKLSVSFDSGVSVNGVKFSSSNPGIVTVDVNGVIVGRRAGKAEITAKAYNGKRATCMVRVINPAKNIKFANAKQGMTLKKGQMKQLKIAFYPGNTSIRKLEWKVTNKKILSVTNDGKIKGLQKGKTTVVAKTTDGSNIRIKLRVTVR